VHSNPLYAVSTCGCSTTLLAEVNFQKECQLAQERSVSALEVLVGHTVAVCWDSRWYGCGRNLHVVAFHEGSTGEDSTFTVKWPVKDAQTPTGLLVHPAGNVVTI
jgi:hypothetical protein